LQYSAPEVIIGEDYDEKVDVYSFAMIMYEIFFEKIAFEEFLFDNMWKLGEKVTRNRLRPSVPEPQSMEYLGLCDSQKLYLDVMVQCWSHEPVLRPSFPAIYYLLEQITRLDQ
jgi:serine/threonine protein kinase